jgi:hypothetical protein
MALLAMVRERVELVVAQVQEPAALLAAVLERLEPGAAQVQGPTALLAAGQLWQEVAA